MAHHLPASLGLAISMVSWALCACDKPALTPPPAADPPPQTSAPAGESGARLFAKSRQPDGQFAVLGFFDFKPGGQVELTVTGSGPEADRLKSAWTEVSGRPSLNTKMRDAEGNLVGQTIARGSPDYQAAVEDVMSREFGFFLSPTKD